MIAAKVLAVIMAVPACISVNDSALITMAAETAASETVSAEAKEDSTAPDDDQPADETVTADDGQTTDETVTADDGQTAEETVASDNTQSTEESTGETSEETEAVDENQASDDAQASDEDPNTSAEEAAEESAEESAEEAAIADAEKADAEKAAEEEELPEMMEIIDSEGVKADGGRKMAGNWPASADDVLNAEVIDADVDTASSGCVLAGVAGKYITDSSAALARINEIRLEACKEGVRNPDTGQPLTEADYVPIKWSGDLEIYRKDPRGGECIYSWTCAAKWAEYLGRDKSFRRQVLGRSACLELERVRDQWNQPVVW